MSAPISALAIARMTALGRAHHHGWAQGFDRYNPPETMEQALAAHKAAQDADEDHTIVVPALTHTTCSSRTSWTIAEDGSLTARIYDVEPSQDGDWGEYTLIERVILTVAPDGADALTQLGGVTIENLDRACRVWRAVRNVCERAPEPEDDGAESPEVVRIQRTWAD